MRSSLTALTLFACLLGSAAPTPAEEAHIWREVGEWSIYTDQTLNNGCFASTFFEDGTGLRIGFDPTRTDAPLYVVLGNEKWASLEEGKAYDLIIQMDNETPWEAPASGVTMGDPEFVLLYVATDDPAFLDHFARQHRMRVSYNGRMIADMNLRGSYKAATALAQCQLEGGKGASDPFSGPAPTSATDPFA